MAPDDRGHGVRKGHGREDLGSNLGMDPDLLELLRRQRTGLGEDVLGYGELPDVVEEGRGLDPLNLDVRHAQGACEPCRIRLHAPDVIGCCLVLRVDGECERLDGGQVQLRHLLRVAALVVDPAEISAVHQVQRGGRQWHEPHNRDRQYKRHQRGTEGDEGAARIDVRGKRPCCHWQAPNP